MYLLFYNECFFSTACNKCAPGTGSIQDIADKLDESKLNDDKILTNIELNRLNDEKILTNIELNRLNDEKILKNTELNRLNDEKILTNIELFKNDSKLNDEKILLNIERNRLNSVKILTNIELNRLNDEKILTNIELFKKESLAWYEKLNANDQELVHNQINLIRNQKIANQFLTDLIESTETIKEEIKETQIIAEYSAPLNNLANIARLYNRIPKNKVGLLQNGRPLNHFKARALRFDRDGLYDSIDLAIQLLTGKGSHFHNGKSVFEYQPRYCKKTIYSYFTGRLTEGILLYKTALKLNKETISVPTQHEWVKGFVRIREEYSRQCGCPGIFSFKVSGKISTLLKQLPEPKQIISQNFKEVALLPHNIFTRQKILNLIAVQNFDITQENLALLDGYTYEDIQLVENLVKSKQYDNLAQLYDGAGTCINNTLNNYGKYIHVNVSSVVEF